MSGNRLLTTCLAIVLISGVGVSAGYSDELLKTPSSYLGIDITADRVLADWHQISEYFAYVAKESDRVKLERIGESQNGHQMITAYISSPKNIENLSSLLELQRQLTFSPPEKNETSRWQENKLFVLVNCSLHSTEVGPAQFSLKLLHQLATANSEDIVDFLDNCVLILVPSPNPDGLQMVVEFYRQSLGEEYEGISPPQLYHEYAGHDNNRDWYMLNLKETRILNSKISQEWFPQVVWDLHQMGSRGYRAIIPPFVGPPNPFIHPLVLSGIENAGHAMKYQILRDGHSGVAHSAYFSVWWNGGFRTTPYFKNSIGLLTELASANLATPIEISADELSSSRSQFTLKTVKNPAPWTGGRWGLPEITAIHQSAAKGLFHYLARNHRILLDSYRKMSLSGLMAEDEGPAGYLIERDQHDSTALLQFIDILQQHGIKLMQTGSEFEFLGKLYPQGTVVVDARHPFRPMIRSLMERVFYPVGGERDNNPYDVSASTLVDLFGLASTTVSKEILESGSLELEELTIAGKHPAQTSSGHTYFAASDSRSYYEINKLLADFSSVYPDKFEINGNTAEQFVWYNPGRDVRGMDISGEIEYAGNRSMKPVRVGLLKGNFNSIDEGWTRFLLERFKFPFESIDEETIQAGQLNKRFDVIILPNIRENTLINGDRRNDFLPPDLKSGIGRDGLQKLESFVLKGGKLISLVGPSRALIKYYELPVTDVTRGLSREEFNIPGSILKVLVSKDTILTFGMQNEAAVMFQNALAFAVAPDSDQVEVIATYADDGLLLSGFAVGEDKIAGQAAAVQIDHGDGNIIMFGFPVQFRAQTYSTFKLLFNAIYSGSEKFKVEKEEESNYYPHSIIDKQ